MVSAAVSAAVLHVVTTALLGMRLLHLFWSQGAPSGLLAIALLLGAVPVHGSALLLAGAGVPPSAGRWQLAYAALLLGAGVASACVMRFTTEVFRPRSRWLPRVNAAIALLFALAATTAPFHQPHPIATPLGVLCAVTLVCVLAWAAFESIGHWAMYRRVQGLDALVVARFGLWGIAALANVFVVPLVFLAGERLVLLGVAALPGMLSSLALWLAFLPPAAYARRIRRLGAPLASPPA